MWCNLITPFKDNLQLISDPDTLALVCEVMMRKNKNILVLRALKNGLSNYPYHPALSLLLIKFIQKIGHDGSNISDNNNNPAIKSIIQNVLTEKLSVILSSSNSNSSNSSSNNSNSNTDKSSNSNGNINSNSYIEKYLAHCKDTSSLLHKMSGARMLIITDKSATGKKKALSLLTDACVWEGRGLTTKNLAETLQVSVDFCVFV